MTMPTAKYKIYKYCKFGIEQFYQQERIVWLKPGTFSDLLGEYNLLMNKTCHVLQAARERVSDFHSDDTGGL